MADTFDAETKIETEIAKASSASVDGMSVTNRSVDEIIKADKHLSRKKASRFGFGIGVMRAPEHY